ncbi:MAG: hypothetical protein LIR46_07820 [Bacteroidota bacterium]|nr:hypothetical protein [Bacteroidota bacterium]
MFVRTSNGYLINLDEVKRIYVSVDKANICSVRAKQKDNTEEVLYRDKEMQYCLEYLNKLADEIAVKVY